MDLRTNTATINARGIEFDPSDKTFWVSDFEGSIYKTAGFEIETGVGDEHRASDVLTVHRPVPNPFGERTVIGFVLAQNSNLRVEVFSAGGTRVAVLHNGTMQAGEHSLAVQGSQLASGVYTVVFSINNIPVASCSAVHLR